MSGEVFGEVSGEVLEQHLTSLTCPTDKAFQRFFLQMVRCCERMHHFLRENASFTPREDTSLFLSIEGRRIESLCRKYQILGLGCNFLAKNDVNSLVSG